MLITNTKNTKNSKPQIVILFHLEFPSNLLLSLLLLGINLSSLSTASSPENSQNLPSRDFLSQYPPPTLPDSNRLQSSASPSQGKRSYTCTRYRYHVVWPVVYSISMYKYISIL
ncbi:hypothetical protein H0G86_001444 [Trichoderma simmonsii]|uniref:Uncharacterized protein n=1 Tax=Trichoderma simmonsii TaxID=1491479 RepID=A0A8G0L3U3_9HYPO|nr:hypothetical protein H0G86_001444 [Trichoderma simmonsii]